MDTPISHRSEGPTPDSLGLKLSGETSLYQDLRRTQEVEVVVRGTVTGHIFEDKYDKNGNVAQTVKYAKIKVDEMVEVTVLSTPRYMRGQTAMGDEGQTVDETGQPLEDRDQVVDAEVVGELPPGEPPPGVDSKTGEVTPPDEEYGADAETEDDDPELELDDFDRDPLVPEDAWAKLDKQQKEEVAETVARLRRLGDALAEATNPTDKSVAEKKIKELAEGLAEDFGMTLNDPAEIEEVELPPAPPPVLEKTGPMSAKKLRERRAFLEAQRSLPREAKQARDEELAEIDRRLSAQEGGNDAERADSSTG